MTSMAVVLAVGARLNGQASLGTRTFNTTSLWSARVDLGLPVMAMILTRNRLKAGNRLSNSSDSPE